MKALRIIAIALLAGCQSSQRIESAPVSGGDPASAASQATTAAIEDRLGILPPQTLDDGDCGLFLFSGQARRLVLVVQARSGEAKVQLDGRQRTLDRVLADGEMLFGLFTEQQFAYRDLELSVSFVPDRNTKVGAGAIIRQGRLTLTDGGGWRYVTPVAGAIACEQA